MPSTNHTTILARTGQRLAVAALMTGLAFGAAPIANAKWDQAAYDRCLSRMTDRAKHFDWDIYLDACCAEGGGKVISDKDGYSVGCNRNPPAQGPGAPPTGKPGDTSLPQQGGEQGPGAPITPVPAGPAPAQA